MKLVLNLSQVLVSAWVFRWGNLAVTRGEGQEAAGEAHNRNEQLSDQHMCSLSFWPYSTVANRTWGCELSARPLFNASSPVPAGCASRVLGFALVADELH